MNLNIETRKNMQLRGKQKRYLRAQAHHLQPLFQVGKGGLSEAMITQIGEALEKRELLKVSFLQNTEEEPADVGEILEKRLNCNVVQEIGKTLVLFKPSSKVKYQNHSLEVRKIG